jgi:hypothetical protein
MNIDITHWELLELFDRDPLEAIKIADQWSKSTDLEKYDAAVSIRDSQTVLPACEFCRWPIIDDKPHTNCDYVMGVSQDPVLPSRRDRLPFVMLTQPTSAWNPDD